MLRLPAIASCKPLSALARLRSSCALARLRSNYALARLQSSYPLARIPLGCALALACYAFAPLCLAEEFEVNPPDSAVVSNELPPPRPKRPPVSAVEEIGRKLFFDPALSASGKLACASCHDPKHAYAPANALAVQLGGPDLRAEGPRAAPSLRYQQNVPLFTEHFFDEDKDESVDAGPTGGHTWDGRAANLAEQARIPLLAAAEMANADASQVAAKVQKAAYAAEFRQVFGENVFDKPDAAFDAVLQALSVFQQNPEEFYPYSSKYDAFLRGEARLSRREARGLELFNDPDKGNCAACHPSQRGKNKSLPSFSDFGFIATAAPRNRKLAANADPNYYDLGLCGPYREDFKEQKNYCGLFRAPTLRNVATRKAFFHNGVFHSLEQVMHFYVERDLHPEKWYPRTAQGHIEKYDDLPPAYRQNVNQEAPFPGKNGKPALNEREIRDIIAFLKTLNDDWRAPKH